MISFFVYVLSLVIVLDNSDHGIGPPEAATIGCVESLKTK